MNILVIGNGFDLAHELPTSYSDFLEFCRMIREIYSCKKNENIDDVWDKLGINLKKDINTKRLKEKFIELYHERFEELMDGKSCIKTKPVYDEIYVDIDINFWIDYFLNTMMNKRENWIDFESEISNVIQELDDDMMGRNKEKLEGLERSLSNEYVNDYFSEYISMKKKLYMYAYGKYEDFIYTDIRDTLYGDLNRLIRALEIYLAEYVGNIECHYFSPDIEQISKTITGKDSVIISKVLSFNYSNTYERLYFPRNSIEEHIDYIHGKANIENTVLTNNMVLGIDEYLPEERKNKDIEFITFKKFYQRIFKETGAKYKDWADEIKYEYIEYIQKQEEKNRSKMHLGDGLGSMLDSLIISTLMKSSCGMHNLYVFGHSLDVTDGDVLRDLILNDNVHTTIFYHDKDSMGKQIANLVKVIGQNELIRRTGGSTKTIEFKQQAEMIKREK